MFNQQNVVTDSNGRAVSGALIKVVNYPALTNATIYSDNGITVITGSTVKSAVGDNNGNGRGMYNYYIASGSTVQEQISINGVLVETSQPITIPVTSDSVGIITDSNVAANAAISATKSAFTQSGTPAAGTIAAKLQQVVCVKDAPYNAVGDGIANDTAAMQAAHNTGKLVYYPAGQYNFTGNITFSSGGIVGEGQIKTFLVSTDTSTNDLFQYTGTSAALFRDFQIQRVGGSTKTVGSGINVVSTNGNTASYLTFQNINFQDLPTGLTFTRADHFKVYACNFISCVSVGCLVQNSTNGDSGDSVIMGCEFNSNLTTGTLLSHISSSGLKLVGNKFNGAAYGYVLALNTLQASSINVISGNSFENMSDTAIIISRAGGSPAQSATWRNVIIAGNEIAIMPRGISAGASTFVITNLAITGNTFDGVGAGGYCIGISYAVNLEISGNVFNGNGGVNATGVSLTSCTGKLGQNVYAGLTAGQEISLTTCPNLYTQQDSQSGTATTSNAGWSAWVGALFISPVSTVTFPRAFLVAPAISDISLVAGATAGEMCMIVESVSKTQFTYQVISSVNNIAATTQWKAWGTL